MTIRVHLQFGVSKNLLRYYIWLNYRLIELQVWKYGNKIKLLFSRQVVDDPDDVNFVEFNKAETHLIAHCITPGEEFLCLDGIVMVLSIHTGQIGEKNPENGIFLWNIDSILKCFIFSLAI